MISLTTLSALSGLMLAGWRFWLDSSPINKLQALTDFAANTGTLRATIKSAGLAPLEAEMVACADQVRQMPWGGGEDLDAIFMQVFPVAIANRNVFVDGNLQSEKILDLMVAEIRAAGFAFDFSANAESYFRRITRAALDVMLSKPETISALHPLLWRHVLVQLQSTNDMLSELMASKEARSAASDGLSEAAILSLVRPLAQDVNDIGQATVELTRAVEEVVRLRRQDSTASGLGPHVDNILKKVGEVSATGAHDTAIAILENAECQEKAASKDRRLRFLSRAIDEYLLVRDADKASEKIIQRLKIERDQEVVDFEMIMEESSRWFSLDSNEGTLLDLKVAASLTERAGDVASTDYQRGRAANERGRLLNLGARRGGSKILHAQAVQAFEEASSFWKVNEVPELWATSKINVGNALRVLGGSDRRY